MQRAAIIIGVEHSGNLPKLRDAARGAREFERWARSQGFSAVEVLTDENGREVTSRDIKKAIKRVLEPGTYEQLLIYFAGHGVNLGYHEYWLLTDAPGDPQEAVNVAGSEALARYSGVPHVMFISDACRTAAEGIRAQAVTGSEIFPNDPAGCLENAVDLLFGCSLGRPALEVRDPDKTAGEYRALYTGALLDGLGGKAESLLEWSTDGDAPVALVRPRPLKQYLSEEVPRRIADLDLVTKVIQIPDGRINSDPSAWVARHEGAAERSTRPSRRSAPGRDAVPSSSGVVTAESISASLLSSALSGDEHRFRATLEHARAAPALNLASVASMAERAAVPFGPTHHETACGFKIRGARIADAFSVGAEVELFQRTRDAVRVDQLERPGASVLLVLESGNGFVLPAIPEFLAALTVEDEELVDVAYEPSENTWRWDMYRPRARDVRALRAVAAASTRSGVFRLEVDDAFAVARRMQIEKGVDPALAIYAAYAYSDMQRRELIAQMSGYLRSDLDGSLFDVALLAGELSGKSVAPDTRVFGFVPLLSQGWALLSAYRVSLPEVLRPLRATLVPSVWTSFNPDGVAIVRAAMQKGDVR